LFETIINANDSAPPPSLLKIVIPSSDIDEFVKSPCLKYDPAYHVKTLEKKVIIKNLKITFLLNCK
jgi:hypothetical protein